MADTPMTSTLNLTWTRLAVLRAVQAGKVYRHRGWGKGEKTQDVWTEPDGVNTTVTRTCNELCAADPRLIRPGRTEGPSLYSPQRWELTDDGAAVLAAEDERLRRFLGPLTPEEA